MPKENAKIASPKKLLQGHKNKNILFIFPCFTSPQIWFRVEIDKNPSLGVAEEILEELMRVSTGHL